MKLIRTAIAVAALAATLVLTGCSSEGTPVLSTPDRVSTKPPEQLLKGTMRQVNDLAVYLGGKWESDPGSPWDPNDTTGWAPGACGDASKQYSVDIQDVSAVADPVAEIAKVRAYWNKLGFHDISQIGPAAQDADKLIEINVFLAGKAGLQFSASRKERSISVRSECGNF